MNLRKLKMASAALKRIARRDRTNRALRWFNMSWWGFIRTPNRKPSMVELKCATKACAIGTLCVERKIPGLKFEVDEDMIYPMTFYKDKKGKIRKATHFKAVRKVFDLNTKQAVALFGNSNDRMDDDPESGGAALRAVIRRIDLMIFKHEQF